MHPEGSQKEVRRQAKGMGAEVLVELARMSNSTERRIWHSAGAAEDTLKDPLNLALAGRRG